MYTIVDPVICVPVHVDGMHVELAVLKERESGLVFAVDSSYVEQAVAPIVSPYCNGTGREDSGVEDGGEISADVLMVSHGGTWGELPDHPVCDWQYAVSNDDTRAGYWEWVASRLGAEGAPV